MKPSDVCLFCDHLREVHTLGDPNDPYNWCMDCLEYCEQEEYEKEGD